MVREESLDDVVWRLERRGVGVKGFELVDGESEVDSVEGNESDKGSERKRSTRVRMTIMRWEGAERERKEKRKLAKSQLALLLPVSSSFDVSLPPSFEAQLPSREKGICSL